MTQDKQGHNDLTEALFESIANGLFYISIITFDVSTSSTSFMLSVDLMSQKEKIHTHARVKATYALLKQLYFNI